MARAMVINETVLNEEQVSKLMISLKLLCLHDVVTERQYWDIYNKIMEKKERAPIKVGELNEE